MKIPDQLENTDISWIRPLLALAFWGSIGFLLLRSRKNREWEKNRECEALEAVKLETDKRILPAFILQLFLGYFGAHRFYIGRPVSGIIQLILCIVGFFQVQQLSRDSHEMGGILLLIWAVWFIIDFVRIVTGSITDGYDRRIQKWT